MPFQNSSDLRTMYELKRWRVQKTKTSDSVHVKFELNVPVWEGMY